MSAYSLGMNVAVAVFGIVMLMVQVAPLTALQPVQLLKREPGAGSATSVTVRPVRDRGGAARRRARWCS